MILILECGSTKSDWLLLSHKGREMYFSDHGINPSTLSEENLETYIREGAAKIPDPGSIRKIYHYGAGVTGEKQQNLLKKIYRKHFSNAVTVIENDLFAAVRATLGNTPGITCILGTGSNSGYFDGEKISANYQGFGYIIGDEGSGLDIGTRMIKLYYSESLPPDISPELDDKLADRSSFVKELYSHPRPNRFLAGFSRFAGKHQKVPAIRAQIKKSFTELIENYLSKYPDFDKVPINFVGSISEHFRDILEESLEEHGMKGGKFVSRPITELEMYHHKELE